MVDLFQSGVYLIDGEKIITDDQNTVSALLQVGKSVTKDEARKGTISYQILAMHDSSDDPDTLCLKYDSLTSHDITYVGILQTARASGMKEIPLPYVLTNCHNSLCAVGGTINEDDHVFALSAAKKYGGIFVPANLGVIHSYNREVMAGCGRMILGSDSHTRYGALGTMAVGEGGGELVKQLVGRTCDLPRPEVIAVYLEGRLQAGVGPQDVALAIIGKVYHNGYVKNKVMEFVGPGIAGLSVELRNGIDVMTTETACWSSIWETDEKVREYYRIHGREQDYQALAPSDVAYYDGLIYVDLSQIKPMIAMPFHPSNIYTIAELKENLSDILDIVEKKCLSQLGVSNLHMNLQSKIHQGEFYVEQGIVAGCSGGIFDNICAVADIIGDKSIGNRNFSMSVYPGSQPEYLELLRNGTAETLMRAGVILRSAFCGPCFGAGNTPANGEFSIRHTTRNFPNREGSKPTEGQLASVALMDARSIAATAINGGRLTAATDLDVVYTNPPYHFDQTIYKRCVFNGFGQAQPETALKFGPNIKDWPEMPALTDTLLLKVVSYITDPVTTTDELIPSGETASFRSDPMRLAEFTLSRKDPSYVGRAKQVHEMELAREAGNVPDALRPIFDMIRQLPECEGIDPLCVGIGSTIYAACPGDGSAREQAASCQRVLGAWANIAAAYATKRYRSNCINWGILPFQIEDASSFENGDYILVPQVCQGVYRGDTAYKAYVLHGKKISQIELTMAALTKEERDILASGCLINYYRALAR